MSTRRFKLRKTQRDNNKNEQENADVDDGMSSAPAWFKTLHRCMMQQPKDTIERTDEYRVTNQRQFNQESLTDIGFTRDITE